MARPDQAAKRRLPIGAEVQPGGGVHFRVWAPRCQNVAVEIHAQSKNKTPLDVRLSAESQGYYSGFAPDAAAGMRYGFRLNDQSQLFPDPASRRQPDGPHGLSEILDPAAFGWTDHGWRGASLERQVIYEMHIGTFTPEGTWAAAAREFAALVDLGVTVVEVMPVAEFVGEFGWGYDGVDLFAPTRNYGTPDDFRRFVDEAHRHGLAVMLDVVYNHFGPSGNYLGQFSGDYLSPKHHTGWGDAINYDGANCGPVREFFIANAGYWIDEYHIDGLRLDAVHAIVDDSKEHILKAIGKQVRAASAGRQTMIVVENEKQQSYVMRPIERGGYGLDGGWNDDFHHAARVAATGHSAYYFGDYQGTPQELISLVKWGHLYQGQWNERQQGFRGTPGFDLDGACFVNFLQNHDQIGNVPPSCRLHELTTAGRFRALTALLCLAPGTPLLFQGQEFAASSRFYFFADHEPQLAEAVRQGRQADVRNFTRQTGPVSHEHFADPESRQTFERSKLDLRERDTHREIYRLHRDLLRLRREDVVFSSQRAERIDGAVIGPEAFVLRYRGDADDDRLVLVNLGRELEWNSSAEPLLALARSRKWRLLWTSEDPAYGRLGTAACWEKHWLLPGHAAVVLAAVPG